MHLTNNNNDDDETTRTYKLEAVAQVCDAHLLVDRGVGVNFTDTACFEQLIDMAPQFNETLFHCKYRNFTDTCEKLFAPIITEEGVCYTFNALNGKEIYRNDS